MAQFPSSSSAYGIWTLQQQRDAVRGDNWPSLFVPTVDYLVIGGGGGGGGAFNLDACGGGGGAGAFYSSTNVEIQYGTTYTISVGAGGAGGAGGSNQRGGHGGDSSISTFFTANGGGGAGTYASTSPNVMLGTTNGGNGSASGDGGAGTTDTTGVAGGTYGNAGGGHKGTGQSNGSTSCGGGGGAGGAGVSGVANSTGGAGGAGSALTITGSSVTYAGGGGGGATSGGGVGGSGGGGAGASVEAAGQSATANTGSGGGGASAGSVVHAGGNGGSGVVILRTLATASATTGSPTVTTDGNYNIYTFTGSGSIALAYTNSVLFDGSGDYLASNSSADFGFGTGDWTIECWVYPLATSSNMRVWRMDQGDNADINIGSTGSLNYYNGSGSTTSAGGLVAVNQWSHIAIVRSSGTVKGYVNGVEALSQSTTPNTTARNIYIGGDVNTLFNGYMSNFRVVKGTAVYTSNFTVPTSNLTAIAGTVLLTCQQDNILTDGSGTSKTLTVNGNLTASTQTPF